MGTNGRSSSIWEVKYRGDRMKEEPVFQPTRIPSVIYIDVCKAEVERIFNDENVRNKLDRALSQCSANFNRTPYGVRSPNLHKSNTLLMKFLKEHPLSTEITESEENFSYFVILFYLKWNEFLKDRR